MYIHIFFCRIFSQTLIAACTDNDVPTVRRLLSKNTVSISESTDDGESLLSMACSAGYYELAQVLLAMQAAQVEDKGQKDCTPLMEAASAGHVEIVKLLISHNADVNAHCATGNTPLMFACAGGHVEVVKELLKHGANVEEQNENGHTPLMEAASAGHVEVAKVSEKINVITQNCKFSCREQMMIIRDLRQVINVLSLTLSLLKLSY